MTIRHLKFDMPQIELLILCDEYAPSVAFPISGDSSSTLQWLRSRSSQLLLLSPLSLSHADLQFTSKLTWLYLPNITRSRSLLSTMAASTLSEPSSLQVIAEASPLFPHMYHGAPTGYS